MKLKDETGYIKMPWMIIAGVLAAIVGVWIGTHYFMGCSSLLDACAIVKK